LQEDIEYLEQSSANALSIDGYSLVSSCRGEALWKQMREFKYGGRHIRNAIYVRTETVDVVRAFSETISSKTQEKYPRCAAVADVTHRDFSTDQLPLRVASVHFSGGRFMDAQWKQSTGEKAGEARRLLALRPDVVAGDLNSYTSAADVRTHQEKYTPYVDAVRNNGAAGYIGWALEGVDEVRRGMQHCASDGVDTSKYGGTVDHFFAKPGRVSFEGGCRSEVQNPVFGLSDHNAVVATVVASV
jgi:endonuclease/exonuclease/phosphatase family metal-dependent hydrolase